MHEYDLEEIKRETVEGRSLMIKTNNLVNALSADLKSIAKRQQSYERRIVFHSIGAYTVTTLVILWLTNAAMDAQVQSVLDEGRENVDKVETLENEVKLLRKREEKRLLATQEAARLNQLLRSDRRREFLTELPKVSNLALSPTERDLFETEARKVRRELSHLAYQTGIEHLRAERYHEATQSLREALDLEADAPHSPQARYELARAYRALDQQKSAIYILMKLTVAAPTLDVLDEATMLLAECQIDIELYNDAKETLRGFLRRFPDSPLRLKAKSKLAELEIRH